MTPVRKHLLVIPAVALASAATIAALMVFGVRISEVATFCAYEVAYVFFPGWAVYAALTNRTGLCIRNLASAWGLGFVVEVLAFIASTILGARPAFLWYPLAVGAVAGAVLVRRSRPTTDETCEGPHVGSIWGGSIICALAMAYLASSYFIETPLPGAVSKGMYFRDYLWNLGMTAEARNHWPVGDPRVAGEPMKYYTFVFYHLAAVNYVTSLPLPLLLSRLAVTEMMLLLVVQCCVLGRWLRGDGWTGVLCAALVVLAGEVDPFLEEQYYFLNEFFFCLCYSYTFLLGLLLFIPLVIEISDCLLGAAREKGQYGVLLLLAVGCGGTKSTILPVVTGGILLWTVWAFWARNSWWRRAFGLAIVVLVVCVVSATLFSPAMPVWPGVRPMGVASHYTTLADGLSRVLPEWMPPRIFRVLLCVIGLTGFLGVRVLGLISVVAGGKARLPDRAIFLVAVFAVSLLPYYMFDMPCMGQEYFLYYGYVACCALAADGLWSLWRGAHGSRRVFAMTTRCFLVVAFLVCLADTPLDRWRKVRTWLSGRNVGYSETTEITHELLDGLDWVRRSTPVDAVLAVNNQCNAWGVPFFLYYSAFSERRILLEGWLGCQKSLAMGFDDVRCGKVHPYPQRLALNEAVFREASDEAIRTMQNSYRVTHLLVDKVNGPEWPYSGHQVHLVYSNRSVEVFAVKPLGSRSR